MPAHVMTLVVLSPPIRTLILAFTPHHFVLVHRGRVTPHSIEYLRTMAISSTFETPRSLPASLLVVAHYNRKAKSSRLHPASALLCANFNIEPLTFSLGKSQKEEEEIRERGLEGWLQLTGEGRWASPMQQSLSVSQGLMSLGLEVLSVDGV